MQYDYCESIDHNIRLFLNYCYTRSLIGYETQYYYYSKQNNLKELWSLFDFIFPGRLGSLAVFEQEFCNPIREGGYAGASRTVAEVAARMAGTLQRIVKPYLLRRHKDDLQHVTTLPKKTEQVTQPHWKTSISVPY